jgi:hypothetical protein
VSWGAGKAYILNIGGLFSDGHLLKCGIGFLVMMLTLPKSLLVVILGLLCSDSIKRKTSMTKITQYWDDNLKLGIYVEDGRIRHFFYKKPFKSSCFDITEQRLKMKLAFSRIGTAYHSGNKGVQIVDYCGKQSIYDLSGEMRVTIATDYSICDKEIDYSEFYHKNMISFYTPELELMSLIGCVVIKEKIKEPLYSFYEMQNNITKVEKTVVECDGSLNGDNLGQMSLALALGGKVLNSICTTPFKNFFYGRVLSCTRVEGCSSEVVLARTKDLNPVVPCAYDLATKWCVPSKDIGIDTYGDCKIHIIRDDEIAQINTIGYIAKFSGGKFSAIYSYDKDEVKPEFEAGWNCINDLRSV